MSSAAWASVSASQALAVAGGAAIGALLRWVAGLALNAAWAGFPLGTWLVNCIGGFAIGVAVVWFARSPEELARLFWITGLLGGFTTFSAFSAESLDLLQRQQWALALLHSGAHLFGALACTALGYVLARSWLDSGLGS